MKRATVYASQPSPARKPHPGEPVAAVPAPRTARWKNAFLRHERWAMLFIGLAIGGAMWWASERFGTPRQVLTQKDIDGAVLKTLETVPLPSKAAKAYEAILPSVVRVTKRTSAVIAGRMWVPCPVVSSRA